MLFLSPLLLRRGVSVIQRFSLELADDFWRRAILRLAEL